MAAKARKFLEVGLLHITKYTSFCFTMIAITGLETLRLSLVRKTYALYVGIFIAIHISANIDAIFVWSPNVICSRRKVVPNVKCIVNLKSM